MTTRALLHLLVAVTVILAGYFWGGELHKQWEMIRTYHYTWHMPSLWVAFSLVLSAFLTDTLIFQVCINRYVHQNLLSFPLGFSLLNTSNILKYIPGTVWGYTAQLVWFSQRGVAISSVVYVNFICSLSAILTSLLIGSACSLYYFSFFGMKSIVIFVTILSIEAMFICSGARFIDFLLTYINTYLKKEIRILPISVSFLVFIHTIYAAQWILLGLAGYCVINGIGLAHDLSHLYAMIFSLSLAWVIGYVSLLSPGGLGVREGVMYAILQHITDAQTSLILPVAMRVLYLLVDCCLGIVGSLYALKWRVFSPPALPLTPEGSLQAPGA